MLANYGFADGSGSYYITIDTDRCAECEEHSCLNSCPQNVYNIEEDDWDDEVLVVRSDKAHKLKELCVDCKLHTNPDMVPCIQSCPYQAIRHNW